ncbi:hypothetical protein KUTeg_011612, partial [Tegillarca granosa]
MGCSLSNDMVLQEPEQLEAYLTPEEIRLVQESWSIVSEDYTLMHTKADGTVDFDNDRLKNHATIVMEGLGAAVECLEDSVHLSNIL